MECCLRRRSAALGDHIYSELIDMYVPNVLLARQSIEFDDLGTILLFEVHDPDKFPRDLLHDEVARLLRRGDAEHRNVFLVAPNGTPVWRVGDYKHFDGFPDQFVQLWEGESTEYVFGWTFCGYKTRINLADGEVTILDWTK